MLSWRSNGMFALKVVGTSYYRDALKQIAKNPLNVTALGLCDALLRLEPDNLHDPNAISVWIQGHKVGHISRDVAPRLCSAIKNSGSTCQESVANAFISGGLETIENTYEYLVELDIAAPFQVHTSLGIISSKVHLLDRFPPLKSLGANTYGVRVWLPVSDHSELHKRRLVNLWTTDQWSVVNFYAANTKSAGLGFKLTELDKLKFAEIFGENDIEAHLTDLNKRFASLEVRKINS